jgi:hypothetical protein
MGKDRLSDPFWKLAQPRLEDIWCWLKRSFCGPADEFDKGGPESHEGLVGFNAREPSGKAALVQ